MNIKMIVMDLDGTLLHSDRECSTNSMNYLKKLRDLGYIIVIATGRTLGSALSKVKGNFFSSYIISNNGAIIYDVLNNSILFESEIDSKVVSDIYYDVKDEIDSFTVTDDKFYYRYHSLNNMTSDDKKITNIESFLVSANKIIHGCIEQKKNIDVYALQQKLSHKYYLMDFLIMQDSFSDNKWIDFFKANTSKYNSIKTLADLCNINNNNIVCFGDGLNDISMITNCGIGVAMGNALMEVKEKADYVTLTNDEDGVVAFLADKINL